MLFAYDVTDLVSSRERVKEAEERVRLAIESANVGTWDYDPKSGEVRCDARYRRLFGLGADVKVNVDMFMAAIHPDDRKAVDEAARRSFDPTRAATTPARCRTRGIEDGIDRWMAVRGRTFFDEIQGSRLASSGPGLTSRKRGRPSSASSSSRRRARS